MKDENMVLLLMFTILIVLLTGGCSYHHAKTKDSEILHIGFPQFSDDKEINLIKLN